MFVLPLPLVVMTRSDAIGNKVHTQPVMKAWLSASPV